MGASSHTMPSPLAVVTRWDLVRLRRRAKRPILRPQPAAPPHPDRGLVHIAGDSAPATQCLPQSFVGPLLQDGERARVRHPQQPTPHSSTPPQRPAVSLQQRSKKTSPSEPSEQHPRVNKAPPTVCDRCDGPHPSKQCPIFKKPREQHPDALQRTPVQMGDQTAKGFLPSAKVFHQPGDGSCLYHSLTFGLQQGSASALRRELARWVSSNPHLKISDTPLHEWVRWDAQCSVQQYAQKMARGGWGGGIEMMACSRLRHVDIHVYERRRGALRCHCANSASAGVAGRKDSAAWLVGWSQACQC